MLRSRESAHVGPEPCSFCGYTGRFDGHVCEDEEEPYMGEEPLGTCVVHGDYWTNDCLRCRGER